MLFETLGPYFLWLLQIVRWTVVPWETELFSAQNLSLGLDLLSDATQYVYKINDPDIFHVVINNSTLYVNATMKSGKNLYGNLWGRNGYLHAATAMVAKVMCYRPVPNTEFFLNCGDLPGNKPAIFSWVKKTTSADTMWAYWSFLYMDHLVNIRGDVDFSNKLSVAVWRGSPSGSHWNAENFKLNDRVKLVKMCAGNVSLCDAKLVIKDDLLKTIPFASAAEVFLGSSLSASRNRLSMEVMCRKYK
jgi:hypothetical protein